MLDALALDALALATWGHPRWKCPSEPESDAGLYAADLLTDARRGDRLAVGENSVIGVVLALFFGFQVGLGLYAAKRNSSLEQYFVAGRKLGLPLVSMSLFATWFGAETCLGAAGAIYEGGLSAGRAEPLGYALCLVLTGLFLAPRLVRGRYLTLGDVYRRSFGKGAERLVVCVLLPSALVWGASQVRALGQILAYTTGISVEAAILLAAFGCVLYTGVGGLFGDVLTDFFQGLILAFGLGAVLCGVVSEWPSAEALRGALTEERLTLFPRGEPLSLQLDRFALPVFGSLVTQEVVARLLASDSVVTAKRGAYVAALLYVLVALVPVILGLIGPALIPGLEEPERLLPLLAERTLSPLLYAIFNAALLAAILSTVDSILLSASALTLKNLLGSALEGMSDRTQVRWSRVSVAVAGLVCCVVALSARGIYQLVEVASGLGTAGLAVTTIAALYDPRPSRLGAIAALLLGLVCPPIFEALGQSAPFLGGMTAALAVYLGFRLAELGGPSAPSQVGSEAPPAASSQASPGPSSQASPVEAGPAARSPSMASRRA